VLSSNAVTAAVLMSARNVTNTMTVSTDLMNRTVVCTL